MGRWVAKRQRTASKIVALLAVLSLIAAACGDTAAEQVSSPAEPDQVEPASDDEPAQAEPETVNESPTTSTAAPTTSTTTTTPRPRTPPNLAGAEITVSVLDNPTMDMIRALTEEFFTEPTGINVEFINITGTAQTTESVLTPELSGNSNIWDVAMVESFGSQRYGAYGRLPGLATFAAGDFEYCLLYTSPSPRDQRGSRMPSSA